MPPQDVLGVPREPLPEVDVSSSDAVYVWFLSYVRMSMRRRTRPVWCWRVHPSRRVSVRHFSVLSEPSPSLADHACSLFPHSGTRTCQPQAANALYASGTSFRCIWPPASERWAAGRRYVPTVGAGIARLNICAQRILHLDHVLRTRILDKAAVGVSLFAGRMWSDVPIESLLAFSRFGLTQLTRAASHSSPNSL